MIYEILKVIWTGLKVGLLLGTTAVVIVLLIWTLKHADIDKKIDSISTCDCCDTVQCKRKKPSTSSPTIIQGNLLGMPEGTQIIVE